MEEPIAEDGVHDSRCLLTIVLTTQNRPQLADRALESALNVDVAGREVVVVDDGSGEPYPDSTDEAVRVIRNDTPQGANTARNRGLGAARGRWVCFLDDDDELVAEGIEASVAELERRQRDDVAVLGTLVSVEERSGKLERHVPHAIPRGADWLAVPRFDGRHAHNGLVVSTATLRAVGGFDPDIKSWTHDELFLRLVLAAEIVTIPETSYFMYEDPGRSTLRQQQLKRAQGILTTLRRHDELHGAQAQVTADLMSAVGLHYARARHWREARQAFGAALKSSPRRRLVWVRIAKAMSGETAA